MRDRNVSSSDLFRNKLCPKILDTSTQEENSRKKERERGRERGREKLIKDRERRREGESERVREEE